MPTYEYLCSKCNHRFEKFQSITDKPLRRCPKCNCKVDRVIHGGAALVFKGAGFYSTDSRTGSASTPPPCGKDAPCRGDDSPCLKKPGEQ